MWDSSLALCCFCYLLLIWFSPKSRHNFSLSWYFMSFVTVGRIIKLKYRPCKPLVWVRDTDWWADFSPEWYLFGQTLLWVTNKKERERERNEILLLFHFMSWEFGLDLVSGYFPCFLYLPRSTNCWGSASLGDGPSGWASEMLPYQLCQWSGEFVWRRGHSL